MGALANWGAIGGAAKGFSKGTETAEANKRHKLDQEREERLATLQHNRQVERDNTRYEKDAEAQKAAQAQAAAMQDDRQTHQTSERVAGQEFKQGESALDRAGRQDVASINQKGQADRSGVNKWTYKQQPNTTTTDPETGAITETKGALTLTDPESNLTYVQVGNEFRYANAKGPSRPPAEKARAEKKLRDNLSPEAMRAYIDKFGYLPSFVFAEMKNSGAAVPAGEAPQQ